MKTTIHCLGAAVLLGVATLLPQSTYAQAVAVTTSEPVTYMGTVNTFGPDIITVRGTDATPVTYHYTKSTTYVDEAGAPVSVETVKSGLPVTVYYTKSGDDMIASKVIVRKTTTTTTHD